MNDEAKKDRVSEERLVFSAIKAHRGWYFVEYVPPVHGYPFATVSLTLLESPEAKRVAEAMEFELVSWLESYPVPIMVSSYTDTGDVVRLSPVCDCDHLIGWLDAAAGVPALHWRIVPADQIPRHGLSPSALRQLYTGVPVRTSSKFQAGATRQQRALSVGAAMLFVWLVVVPAGVALIEFNAPDWLGWLVLFYSLSQAYVHGLRLWGYWPKTVAEVAAADEQCRMRHHHYHCERNPEAFGTLVAQNWARESREQAHREALNLRQQDRTD